MVEQVKGWRECGLRQLLPFKLGKIQTAEVGIIHPVVTRGTTFLIDIPVDARPYQNAPTLTA